MAEANAAPRVDTGPSAGFVYVPDVDPGAMRAARPGAIVRNEDDRPPWIVVDRAIETIVVAKWPGRLWRVDVAEAAGEQVIGSGYMRAVCVEVVEELAGWRLFGPCGLAVVAMIDAVGILTAEDAARLAQAVQPDSALTFSAAWDRWLRGWEADGIVPGDGVTANAFRPSRGRVGSPIGSGFSVLEGAIFDRARRLVGDKAFTTEEDGTPVLTAPWDGASSAVLYAAMALGAPHLCSEIDRASLMAAWRTLAKPGDGDGNVTSP